MSQTNPFSVEELNKRLPVPSEHQEQVRFLGELTLRYPQIRCFSIPNAGKRTRRARTELKAEGMTPGVPDLFIPALNCWVEMKKQKGGQLSPAQKELIAYLRSLGHVVIIGRGCDDALQQLEQVIQQKGIPT